MRSKPGWPKPMADAVYMKMRNWLKTYEQGAPSRPRAITNPTRPDEQIRIVDGYKHRIPFRLNELNWFVQVLDYATKGLASDDPKRIVYGVIAEAKKRHEELQDKGRIASGVEFSQEYLFDKSHILWLYNILGSHSQGRLEAEMDPKVKAAEIEKADW